MCHAWFPMLLLAAGCNQLFGIHELAGGSPTADGGGGDTGNVGGACSATQLDCDGLPGNGCEADIDSDGSNCGACGHTCGGDRCDGGLCAATTYFQSSTAFTESLALYNGNVLWADLDSASIGYAEIAGSDSPALAAHSAATPFQIMADKSGYYWLDNNGGSNGIIFGCASVPCQLPTVLATEPTNASSTAPAAGAMDDSFVYWHAAGAEPDVNAVSKSGGGTTVVANGNGASSNGMAVVNGVVFFTECCGTSTGLYQAVNGTISQLDQQMAGKLFAFDGLVFGTDLGGNLRAYDTTTTIETTIDTGGAVGAFTVDTSGIYVASDTLGAIARAPLQGSGAIVTLVPASGVEQIVTDDNYVYWAELSQGGADAVRRVHK